MKIYIQKHGQGFKFDGCYAALEGAYHTGDEVILFDDIMEVPASNRIMVVASVEDTAFWFERMGIKEPKAISIIDHFKQYVNRELDMMPLHLFIRHVETPVFVKPYYKVKGFDSGVIQKWSSKEMLLGNLDPTMMVMTSSLIDIKSEYRIYIIKDKGILGMQHYHGDSMIYPDNEYIADIVSYSMTIPSMPSAYTIDIAVHQIGDNRMTEIIECQDAWSIGSYGLPGPTYLQFLKKRWLQLILNKN